MDNTFIKEAEQRVKADTPSFFKKLRKYAFITTIVMSGLMAAATGFGLPAWVITVSGILSSMAATTLANSYLPKKD